MTIFQQLKTEHREIKSLCKKIAGKGSSKTKLSNFGKLKTLVLSHAKSEEAALYDRLRDQDDREKARDLALEGYEEHHVADLLMEELTELSPENERWDAKFEVLKEALEHHIEEEEKDIFAETRKVLSPEELKVVHEEYAEYRRGNFRRKLHLVTEGMRA